jgi:hypothetical protein
VSVVATAGLSTQPRPQAQGATGISRASRARTRAVTAVQLMIVAAAAAMSLALRHAVPLMPGTSAYDGMLFARLARSMSAGDWLGPFNQLTLAKGPGYPFFVAVSHWAGLELKVAEQLVHLAASAAVALAVLVTTRRRWAAVLGFAFLALDPANFGFNSADVMRDNLFASLGVLALALGFLTVLGVVRRSRWAWIVLGAVSTGTVLAGYWITREEGVTILPSLGIVVLLVLVSAWRAARRRGTGNRVERATVTRAAAALVLVGLTAVVPLYAVRMVNDARYGVAVLNDQGDGTFLRAYADWSRVEAGPRQFRVPISAEQRRAVYAVSPAARELRSDLEDPENQWRYHGCPDPTTVVCDYAGGWMSWAIRDAATKAGQFDDGPSSQDFFARLSADISAACDDGRLECAPALPASLQGLQRAPTGLLGENVLVMLDDTVRARLLYETAAEVSEIPPEVRAEYAPVVSELPADAQAAEEQMAEFQDRRPVYEFLGTTYRLLVPLLVLAGVIGLGLALYRAARGRARTEYLPALAIGLAVGVVVRAVLLAIIESADFDVVARYLLPGYAMILSFAVVGVGAGLPWAHERAITHTPSARSGFRLRRGDGPVRDVGLAAHPREADGEGGAGDLRSADDQHHAHDR